jgi:uncharacterized protein
VDSLKNYNIDFVKLKLGEHTFEFEIDDSFFSLKEHSLIDHGKLNVHLLIDKKERLMNLHFHLDGIIKTDCDVCLDEFDLRIEGSENMVVKIVDEPKESDSEIMYLSPNDISFNVYDAIYEIICTHIPMSKTCEDADLPKACNAQMLKFLSNNDHELGDKELPSDPRWDKLKNIKQ